MAKVSVACNELNGRLAQVEERCQSILCSIESCEGYTSTYLSKRLSHKLKYLGAWILSVADTLYQEHKGQGYVCVFLNESNGTTIHWVETEEIVANKSRLAAYGNTVLSVEEATGIITNMLDMLDQGNWVPVVDWVKRFGKSPDLDFSKYPEI